MVEHPLRQERSCTGKMRFETKSAAHRNIANLVKRRPAIHAGRDRIQAYKCDYCAFWHVGHKPKTRHLVKGAR